VDDNSSILHLTAKNAKNWFADSVGADRLAKWVNDKNRRSALKENDLILSTRGTVGYCALVKKNVLPANIDQDVARIAIDSKIIIPEYVLTFLNCTFGQDWLHRNTTGMVQQGLSLHKVKQTPVPILDLVFQVSIKSSVVNAYQAIKDSENCFDQAQNILLSELGLTTWKPKHRLTFVKNYSDTEQAGRIDAEYYKPKYDALLHLIEQNSKYTKRISEIQSYNARGLQPKYSIDGVLDVITSKRILDNGLDFDNFEKTELSNWNLQKKARVKNGDILTYTTGANIGRTAIFLSKKQALASNHVNILRIKVEESEYVAFVMNSLIGRLQTERFSAGSAQVELYPRDIERFVIPFVEKSTQAEIRQNVTESFALRKQSKHLLECAKKAVEMAIEQNEKKAINWLKEQTQDI
jgi:restriction endonuclease S subunit